MEFLHTNRIDPDVKTPRQGLYPTPRLQRELEQRSRFFDRKCSNQAVHLPPVLDIEYTSKPECRSSA